jgi:hypothetical protein
MRPFQSKEPDSIEAELRKQRERGHDRVKETGEVFTPVNLCRQMISEVPLEKRQDPNATFLDPSCGDGNFLVALLEELSQYHDAYWVVNHMIFGVDLMADNVETAKERLGLTPDQPGWYHIVCADALEYDFEFPCPLPAWTEQPGKR